MDPSKIRETESSWTRLQKLRQYVSASIRRGTFFSSAARWLRNRGFFFPMSWPAYAFDRYKRRREQALPTPDFSQIAFPSVHSLVTIVLPAYNGADYIHEVLDSILAQTYTRWELIAVDDGSTDETGSILDEYGTRDSRIFVVHQVNRKLPGALNAGFSRAHGEFLTWVSCDNRLAPEFLEKLVGCLERHSGWDMIYANIDLIDEQGHPLTNSPEFLGYQRPFGSEHVYLPVDPSELNTFPNNIVGSAFLYRARVHGLLGDYSMHRFTLEDYDYWMRVNALMVLRHADFSEPIYQYRFHNESLTGHLVELKIHEKRKALLVYDDFRRDFYLLPMLWILAPDDNQNSEWMTSLRRQIELAGHFWLTPQQAARMALPSNGFPVVAVQFVNKDTARPLASPDLPGYVFRALVSTDGATQEIDPGAWDCCLSTQPDPRAPWFFTPDAPNLLTALDVKARSHFMERLEPVLLTPQSNTRKVTVIVATHRLVDHLRACLASLAAQDFPADDLEVIVVNNNPACTDLDDCVILARQQWFGGCEDRLRLIHCPFPGLSHARNAGTFEARGEILCFLDDDAEASPNWLSALYQAFVSNPDAGVIGGKILLREPEPRPWWFRPAWKRFWSHFDPDVSGFTRVDHWQDFPWGANWSARRAALLAIGGFRTGYGRKGKELSGGEEIVAARLIQSIGWTVGIEPSALVAHHVDRARFTLDTVWKSIRASRRTWYQVQKDLYIPMETGLRAIGGRIGAAARSWRSDTPFKLFFTLGAEITLVVWLAGDLLQRLRKPRTSR